MVFNSITKSRVGIGESVNGISFCSDPGYSRVVVNYAARTLAINLDNMSQVIEASLGTWNCSAFITANSVILGNFNFQTVGHYNLLTQTLTNFTGKDYCKFIAKWQQAAGDVANSRGLIIAYSVTGSLIQVTDTPTCTVITTAIPYPINCIVFDPITSHYFVGTTDTIATINVYEIDFSGTILNTYFINTLSSFPVPFITSLAISQTSNRMYVGTDEGLMYSYPRGAGTLYITSVATGPVLLSNIAGDYIAASSETTDSIINIAIYDVSTPKPVQVDDIWHGTTGTGGGGGLNGVFINTNGLYFLDAGDLIFQGMKGMSNVTVPTRAQDPAGTDKIQHVYRVIDIRDYLSIMESDSSQAAGIQNVLCDHNESNYTEISSINTPFSTEKADVRRLES